MSVLPVRKSGLESINCSVIPTLLGFVMPDLTCPIRIASIEQAGIQLRNTSTARR